MFTKPAIGPQLFAAGAAHAVVILLRTEIERKGCTGAFMALVSLSCRPIGGPQTGPPGACFSHVLGGQQLHWGPAPCNSNTGNVQRHTVLHLWCVLCSSHVLGYSTVQKSLYLPGWHAARSAEFLSSAFPLTLTSVYIELVEIPRRNPFNVTYSPVCGHFAPQCNDIFIQHWIIM